MKRKSSSNRRAQLETLLLPLVLLFTGLILIGGDHVGLLSLDRIQNLWPVALILIGLSDFLANSAEENTPQVAKVNGSESREQRRV